MCSLGLYSSVSATAAENYLAHKNVFISYVSSNDVKALANYAQTKGLQGFIMWELRGDVSPSDTKNSLLDAIKTSYADSATKPAVVGYWTDWSVYEAGRAVDIPAYPIPGSESGVKNDDLTAKLDVNQNTIINYSFIEAQANKYSYVDADGQSHTLENPNKDQIGTLYLFDPWADLQKDDSFCEDGKQIICSFVPTMKKADYAASVSKGNFEAFANLKVAHAGLKTSIAIGGYAHDDTFEDVFVNDAYIKNFVDSSIKLMNHYDIDYIDLDYENPNMTQQQSADYLKLITALSNGLKADAEHPGKKIYITILANQFDILPKTEDKTAKGFAKAFFPAVNKLIQDNGNIAAVNLMTYDFHGAFDYNSQDPNQSRTGFLSNLDTPEGTPAGYDAKFSIEASVQALIMAGISPSEINVGIPAYGRALAGIEKGANSDGLFQTINTTELTDNKITGGSLIPGGDLDAAGCDQKLPLGPSACSGSFTYNYILTNMLTHGFTQTAHTANGVANGTTAYAENWQPAAAAGDFKLTVTNSSPNTGIQISIGDSGFTSDYLSPKGSSKTYGNETNPSVKSLQNLKDLAIHWSSYVGGPEGDCKSPLNFVADSTITINADDKTCSITQPSASH
jgi:GH18 family chitinase